MKTKFKHKPTKMGAPEMWKDEFYVKAFLLAKDGLSDHKIAQACGVSIHAFNNWCDKRPALLKALKDGRRARDDRGKSIKQLDDFVEDHLDLEVKKLWKKITKAWETTDPETRVRELIDGETLRTRQCLWLHSFVVSNFNKLEACRATGINHQMVNKWFRDPVFQKLVGNLVELKKDFVEGCLMGLIAQGDTTATIFAARTLLRDRGYDPKITIKHEGSVTHGHVSLDRILDKLPVESQKHLLDAIKKASPKALPAHDNSDVQDAEFEEVDDVG